MNLVVFKAYECRNGYSPHEHLPDLFALDNHKADVNYNGYGEHRKNGQTEHRYIVRVVLRLLRLAFPSENFNGVFLNEIVHFNVEKFGHGAKRGYVGDGRTVLPLGDCLVGIRNFLAEFGLFHSDFKPHLFYVSGNICLYLRIHICIISPIIDLCQALFTILRTEEWLSLLYRDP